MLIDLFCKKIQVNPFEKVHIVLLRIIYLIPSSLIHCKTFFLVFIFFFKKQGKTKLTTSLTQKVWKRKNIDLHKKPMLFTTNRTKTMTKTLRHNIVKIIMILVLSVFFFVIIILILFFLCVVVSLVDIHLLTVNQRTPVDKKNLRNGNKRETVERFDTYMCFCAQEDLNSCFFFMFLRSGS